MITRASRPLTRETLPEFADVDGEPDSTGTDHTEAESTEIDGTGVDDTQADGETVDTETVDTEAAALQALWDHGALESAQLAAKLRSAAEYWPTASDPDHELRDEAEYLVAHALRTTISHASRLLADARKATAHLPRLLELMADGQLPARWFTFVLRRSTDLRDAQLADLDESVADWDLRVEEDRFSRQLSALVRWLRDQQEAETPSPPQRSVEVFPPDDDGTACLQIHGPAPEILALGRRLDSAARAVQQAQRHALERGEELPFDDGTAMEQAMPLPLSRLRYEILTRSILDTGGIDVPKERFRINVTVPALTLLGVENGPGLLDGIHPLPAEMARELAGQENTWYRVLNDPTRGAFLPLPADKYVPTRAMLEYLRLANPVCAVPGCTRPTSFASQMDHIEEYNHRRPEKGGRTEIFNLHCLCWRHHTMKTAGLMNPIKESITHPVVTTGAGTERERAFTTRHEKYLPDKSPPENAPRDEPPRTENTIGFNPGVTRWTIRGGLPRRVEDECDLITPWLVSSFNALWEQTQKRRAAHRSASAASGDVDNPVADRPEAEPPPF